MQMRPKRKLGNKPNGVNEINENLYFLYHVSNLHSNDSDDIQILKFINTIPVEHGGNVGVKITSKLHFFSRCFLCETGLY